MIPLLHKQNRNSAQSKRHKQKTTHSNCTHQIFFFPLNTSLLLKCKSELELVECSEINCWVIGFKDLGLDHSVPLKFIMYKHFL